MQDHPTEEWRPVVGFESFYSVSNMGRVRRDAPYLGFRAGRIKQSRADRAGYRYLILHAKGFKKTHKVHTLVAAAFIGPRPPGKQINHMDGDKANNRHTNLEYVTSSENHQHAHSLGLFHVRRGVEHHAARLTEADVIAIRASSDTHQALGETYGVSRAAITNIKNGKRWKHLYSE